MSEHAVPPVYPRATDEMSRRRRELAPEVHEAWDRFSSAVFADGALDERTKQLIAVAVAHTTQCPYCIAGHTRLAHRRGATDAQVMEAIWVAAEMRAGAAYAHAAIALEALGGHGHAHGASQAHGDGQGQTQGHTHGDGHAHAPGPRADG